MLCARAASLLTRRGGACIVRPSRTRSEPACAGCSTASLGACQRAVTHAPPPQPGCSRCSFAHAHIPRSGCGAVGLCRPTSICSLISAFDLDESIATAQLREYVSSGMYAVVPDLRCGMRAGNALTCCCVCTRAGWLAPSAGTRTCPTSSRRHSAVRRRPSSAPTTTWTTAARGICR